MTTTPDEAAEASPRVPAPRSGGQPARRAPLAVAAAVTTLWAAVVSLLPILAVVLFAQVATGAGAPAGQVVRVTLAGWLLAHGAGLHTPTGTVALAPLLFTTVAAWRVARAGVHTTRATGARRSRSPRAALLAAGAVAVSYGVLGAGAAWYVSSPGLVVPAGPSALILAGFGFVCALAGALVETGVHARLARRTPMPVRDATRTGLVAALLVLGAGAAAAGTALAVSGGAASKVLAAYHAGVTGQIGLTLVCLVFGPDLAVWAASYLAGPGFALGTGTVVTAARVSLGAVPALPVLAGVPARPAPGWAAGLLAVPLAAGMVAGWLLARRRIRAAAERAGRPVPGRDATRPGASRDGGQRADGTSQADGAGRVDAGAWADRGAPGDGGPRSGGVPVGSGEDGACREPAADGTGGARVATETVRPEPRPATSSVRAAGPDPRTGWVPLLGSALGAGPVAGAVLAAAAWASSGSLGGGHLAELGPRPWPLAGIVAGLVAAGAVVGAAATRTMLGVRRPADR